MYKTKILCIIALFMSIAVVVLVTPATATAAEVIRVLPDAVYPGQEFNVNLTQSGFLLSVGSVTETLPDGFEYVLGSLPSETSDYNKATNELTIEFASVTTITYVVKAGTEEQIEAAEFSGTWSTVHSKSGDIINGPVTSDTKLTFVAEPTPTPPPGNGGSNGGGGGTGGDVGVTATPTASPTSTAGETPKPSPSPTEGATASPAETAAPSTSPTTTAAGKTPGFGAIFAIAGLLSVAYLVMSRRRKA